MKLKKIIYGGIIMLLSILTSCSSIQTKKVVAETRVTSAISYNTIEHDVYNTGLTGAVTNNVDAIRFLMTKQAGVKENHLDLYFGLKETLDLSDSNSTLDIQVRALKYFSGNTQLDTKIKVYVIDSNGTVAAGRYGNAKVTYQDGNVASVDCDNNGYSYQGFSCVADNQSKYLMQSIRTYSFTKDNFQLYSTYSPSATEVNYSAIGTVIVETWTPEIGGTCYQYEVMNISTTKNNISSNLFSASTAKEGEGRDVGANEWYFDSIPTSDPYTNEEKENIPVIIEQVKAGDGGITLYNASESNADYWLRSYGQLENGDSDVDNFNSTIDLSKYDHIAFYADTTESNSDVQVEIKLYWTDSNANVDNDSKRYFRTGSSSFYYVPEEGEPYYGSISSGSYIEKGFKGYVYLDLSTFLQDRVSGSYLTTEKLEYIAKNIRFIFNSRTDYQLSNGLEGVNKFIIKDIQFVDAIYSNLEIEKLFTNINLDFENGTTVDEIIEDLPSIISVGADIKTTTNMQDYVSSSVVENQYLQIEGEWKAGEIDSNGLVELIFTPNDDSIIKLHNEYNFENDVSFIFYGYVKRKIDINTSTSSESSSENVSENNSSEEDFSSSENVSSDSIISSDSSGGSSNTPVDDEKSNNAFEFKIGIGIGTIILVTEIVLIIVFARRKNNEKD